MASPDAVTIGGLLIGVPLAIGIYNVIASRMKANKEQNDQFHARDNKALELINVNAGDIKYLNGYNDGFKDGKAEARAEMKQG